MYKLNGELHRKFSSVQQVVNLSLILNILDRIGIMRLLLIILGGIMACLALIMLVVGCLATGSTRHTVYRAWKARVGGRLSCAIVIFKKLQHSYYSKLNFIFLAVPWNVLYFVLCLGWYLSVSNYGHFDIHLVLGALR